ncbi:50S ribosomal protein L33, partial [Listeria monocytogenes]
MKKKSSLACSVCGSRYYSVFVCGTQKE